VRTPPPPGWEVVVGDTGVQLIDDTVAAERCEEAVRLDVEDVPQMLDLVARTRPGPFLPRTIEMGQYLGIRHGGRLVAMAGERLHPPGWTEISAVCTDPAYRRRGLAARLVLAVAAGIRDCGEIPLLHALGTNTNAIRLYQSLGFRLRTTRTHTSARVPAT
jgi:ribosomal protein S18 acetylase RimI-like enzyme